MRPAPRCSGACRAWRAGSASLIICVQVVGTGWWMSASRSLRYHSNWVLELIGTAQIRPWYVAVWTGPGKVDALGSEPPAAAGTGRIHFASANSAVQSTSIARMSIEESFAASRRTSDTRCWSEAVERKLIAMLYLPPDALLQALAAAANDPDGSGNTYQLSVMGPLLAEPHPVHNSRLPLPRPARRRYKVYGPSVLSSDPRLPIPVRG